MVNKTRLSKFMAYILRHNPKKFGLKLDEQGFVKLDNLMNVIRKRMPEADMDSIIDIVNHSSKKRFQLRGNMIRATYGHSIDIMIDLPEVNPPKMLYHGTPRRSVPVILKEGLKPMSRIYVHLSKTEKEAYQVGSRRDKNPVILKIRAKEAHKNGIIFFNCGNVYLAESIPREFINEAQCH